MTTRLLLNHDLWSTSIILAHKKYKYVYIRSGKQMKVTCQEFWTSLYNEMIIFIVTEIQVLQKVAIGIRIVLREWLDD
jgi:hypothetical protein